jgi:hypothetical protein
MDRFTSLGHLRALTLICEIAFGIEILTVALAYLTQALLEIIDLLFCYLFVLDFAIDDFVEPEILISAFLIIQFKDTDPLKQNLDF